jgi:methylenetetrahydrofolate dehydrogenase (NADP+)/methenyltetrahydrofolate cyclohydrolase
MNENATVTIVHSKTKDIESICACADVLIAAVGKAKMVKKQWVKDGAVIIDVGINFDENGKMCGDVDLEDVIDKVSYISPVPKGVGVVTNSMLVKNVIKAYLNRR